MNYLLAQSAVMLDFGTALTWFAGILAVVVTAGILAACGFAWQAAMALRDIKNDIKGIRRDIEDALKDIEDHENRIRHFEGRKPRRTRNEAEREILES